jgi:hypothetical protein
VVQETASFPGPHSLTDPLLEEVRRFYDAYHEGIEASHRRHRYYYEYRTPGPAQACPEGQRVLHLGCSTRDLLASLNYNK